MGYLVARRIPTNAKRNPAAKLHKMLICPATAEVRTWCFPSSDWKNCHNGTDMQKHMHNLNDPFTVKPDCQQALKPEDPYNCSPLVSHRNGMQLCFLNAITVLTPVHFSSKRTLVSSCNACRFTRCLSCSFSQKENCDTKI